MAKRTDIKRVMIIGSGPIVIGQAAEFDYAGTQACLALKEEGYEVFWPTRMDSNHRPSESESDALSSCATGRCKMQFCNELPSA